MKSVSIVGVFDTTEVASAAAKALNAWFSWIMEGKSDEMPPVFEDFGLDGEEWTLERDSDTDWEESHLRLPAIFLSGQYVLIRGAGRLDSFAYTKLTQADIRFPECW